MTFWIQTNSGRPYFYGCDPRDPGGLGLPQPLDVQRDIVTPLSRLVRFLGHTTSPWSVAAHSVIGSVIAERAMNDRALARLFLWHDASEALVGDVPSPLKALLGGYKDIENRAALDAWTAAGVDIEAMALRARDVKRLDVIMLHAEHRVLQAPEPEPWTDPPDDRDDWPVNRAAVLVAGAVYEGAGWGERARMEFMQRMEDLK